MAEFLQDNLRVFVVPVDILHLPNLTTHEKMVYTVLRSFANPHKPEAFPSYETIARLGSMTRRHAINCVNKLVEKGFIKKEIRLEVSKNRKIKNTSNLYTLQTPKVVNNDIHHPSECDSLPLVNDIHHPSECDSLPLVNDIHYPSECDSPEHNHLTKSNRTISLNNNKRTPSSVKSKPKQKTKSKPKQKTNHVVVDLLSQNGIKATNTTINKWLKLANEETIISAIHEVLKRSDIQNVIGYITRMLEQGYTTPQTTTSKNKNPKVKNLPEWIVKQLESAHEEVAAAQEDLTEEQKKQAVELLKQLGEIDS
jgi:hypothetical protein